METNILRPILELVLILMCATLLIGFFIMIDSIPTGQSQPDDSISEKQEPPYCPKSNLPPRCPREAGN